MQPELSGNLYMAETAVLKKECAYAIMRKLKNQIGGGKEYAYTLKFNATVWTNIEDTTAEGYEAPPQYDAWQNYVQELGYNI